MPVLMCKLSNQGCIRQSRRVKKKAFKNYIISGWRIRRKICQSTDFKKLATGLNSQGEYYQAYNKKEHGEKLSYTSFYVYI